MKGRTRETPWIGTMGTGASEIRCGTDVDSFVTVDALFEATSLISLGFQKNENSEMTFLCEDTGDEVTFARGAT